MNAITKYDPDTERAIRTALQTSLYPGASNDSVSMVLAYCRAANLDPMTKPVHIVPMKVSTGRKDEKGWDIKETRDVVMPGIGLYRINAARTGEYAGCSEPEFGPTRVLKYKLEVWGDGANGRRVKTLVDAEIEYPEWCSVTVVRLVCGQERKFTGKELWLENFAEKGDGGGPNSMWEKRPFAQLAKCAEAQALRKAFPEAVGSQPTADEMEGKTIEGHATEVKPANDLMPKAKAAPATEHAPKPAAEAVDGEAAEDDQQQDQGTGLSQLAEGQRKVVLASAARAGLNEAELLQRFPSITPANITATLKSLREIAEKAEA